MYCSGSGFPGEQFRLLGVSSFRTTHEPPLKYFWICAWITVKNRSLLITGIISPVGMLVPFMKDTATLCLMIVMANFDDTLSITKL
jgi:hypothetical protein